MSEAMRQYLIERIANKQPKRAKNTANKFVVRVGEGRVTGGDMMDKLDKRYNRLK